MQSDWLRIQHLPSNADAETLIFNVSQYMQCVVREKNEEQATKPRVQKTRMFACNYIMATLINNEMRC